MKLQVILEEVATLVKLNLETQNLTVLQNPKHFWRDIMGKTGQLQNNYWIEFYKKNKALFDKRYSYYKKATFELVLDDNWKENFLKNIYPKI